MKDLMRALHCVCEFRSFDFGKRMNHPVITRLEKYWSRWRREGGIKSVFGFRSRPNKPLSK
jgi:hypothetical protein